MAVANVALRAMIDPRITSATALHAIGVMSHHADETGAIHPADDGQIVTDPDYLSRRLGVTKAAIFRVYNLLVELGYIDWRKAARGAERTAGITGQVRLIVSAQ